MKRQAKLSAGAVVVNTVFYLVAAGIATAAWWPIYHDPVFIVSAAAATAIGAAIAIVGAVYRWSAAVIIPLTVVVFALVGVPLAVPSEAVAGVVPTIPGLVDLFSGVILGWKQLLTIELPVGSYQSLLVPMFVTCLSAALVGLTVALRARRGGWAVLFPVAVFGTGIAFGSRQAAWPILLSLGLLSVSLLWLMWRRWHRRRQAIRLLGYGANQRVLGLRPVVSAILVLAIASGGAIAASSALPPRGQREVLRYAIEQPFDPRVYPSPLIGFRGYLKESGGGEALFTVSGLEPGSRIRIATLDTYDGIVYAVGSSAVTSESGTFTRVASAVDQSAVEGEQVTLDVSILGYRGVWLPTFGRFESIAFSGAHAPQLRDSFYYNNTSGTAAVIGGLSQGDRYTIEAVLPAEPGNADLSGATPGTVAVPPLRVPAELTTKLEELTGNVDGPGAQLDALIDGLHAEGYVSHGVGPDEPISRSGHSADRITELLTEQRMIGDGEQYAVAAAIMARELGFPTRVVFGFTVPDDAAEQVTVTGSMVSAWVEVNTAENGWVAIDPTPQERPIPEEIPEDPSTVSRPQSVVQPPLDEREVTENRPPVQSTDEPLDAPNPVLEFLLGLARVLGWLLMLVALILSPFLAVLAIKLQRRSRRRNAPTAVERINGGWREFEDAMIDHGLEPPQAATRREFATSVGGARSAVLATAADRATFSPEVPTDLEATQMWNAVDELTASFGEGQSRWQRLRTKFSARSLGGYSGTTNGSRRGKSR